MEEMLQLIEEVPVIRGCWMTQWVSILTLAQWYAYGMPTYAILQEKGNTI